MSGEWRERRIVIRSGAGQQHRSSHVTQAFWSDPRIALRRACSRLRPCTGKSRRRRSSCKRKILLLNHKQRDEGTRGTLCTRRSCHGEGRKNENTVQLRAQAGSAARGSGCETVWYHCKAEGITIPASNDTTARVRTQFGVSRCPLRDIASSPARNRKATAAVSTMARGVGQLKYGSQAQRQPMYKGCKLHESDSAALGVALRKPIWSQVVRSRSPLPCNWTAIALPIAVAYFT